MRGPDEHLFSHNRPNVDSFGGIQEAEAQVVVAIAWVVPIPAGRTCVTRVVDPTAATYHAVRALRRLPTHIVTERPVGCNQASSTRCWPSRRRRHANESESLEIECAEA